VAATAIVVPVVAAEPALGRWRRAYTGDGAEGMPAHVTLMYPFADESRLDDVMIAALGDVLAAFAPFDVAFGGFGRFDADPPVLYVEPAPARPFLDLIAAIAARFPEYPPFGGLHETVVPHLTVAQTPNAEMIGAAEADVAPHLPIRAHIAAVHVMAHRATDGWRTQAVIAL
jgi:2'-5' RNA ligase